jgi:hypothetical protein
MLAWGALGVGILGYATDNQALNYLGFLVFGIIFVGLHEQVSWIFYG